MTREEQIKQAAQRATNYDGSCNNYAYLNFIEGAEWAEKKIISKSLQRIKVAMEK